jgi:multimeric flavodoxin WrbA
MKILLVNGSPHKNGCTYTALEEISMQLSKNGVESEIYHIGTSAISGCIACGSCRKIGKCSIDDKVNELAERLCEFDGFVFGSPVYYASANGSMTSFLDRAFYSNSHGANGEAFKHKPGAVVCSARRGGTTATYDQLVKYLGISQMPIISSFYWNMVHGNTPEEVMQDEEGLGTMRQLAHNMAFFLE